jgi:hypothetical protein
MNRAAIAVLLFFSASAARSQIADSARPHIWMPAAGVDANYLRYAQSLGLIRGSQWTILPFTPVELLEDFQARRPAAVQRLPAIVSAWYNTTAPFGWNDGAVWRGRGLNVALEGGVAAHYGPVSVALAPLAFFSENKSFPLYPRLDQTAGEFEDPFIADQIDRPQRFGNRSYARLDPGQSVVRIDGRGMTAGVSTMNQWIGPMSEWPFILSNNAAGFPHLFVGSSKPWNVKIGRIHGRIFYGRLSQSAYARPTDTAAVRFTSGISGSYMPAFMPNLELGATRMFEAAWPSAGPGWPEFRKPFEAFLKEHVRANQESGPNQNSDNQLASVYARWTFPQSGVEVYGEFGREDHNWNARDAILEPDHMASVGLGFRKAWAAERGRINGLRAELINLESSTLARERPQGAWYVNSGTPQGHTQIGQVLGAGFAAVEGAGSMVAFERLEPGGDGSVFSFMRLVVAERAGTPPDAIYALSSEFTRPIGGLHVTYGGTAIYEMNRDLLADVGNFMLTARVRW